MCQAAIVDRINHLLSGKHGRFAAYQELPEAVLRSAPALRHMSYQSRQLGLDAPRYQWLVQCLAGLRKLTVVEVGANLGYFSLSLAADLDCHVNAYEPLEDPAETCSLLAELSGLHERVVCHRRGVDLDDLDRLPDADLLISLNVLHHAGSVFGADEVERAGGWRAYSLQWLRRAARKYRMLFLQTGNKSSGPALFESADAVPYVSTLLDAAEWDVEAVGIISDFAQFRYDTWTGESLERAPATTCRRNPDTGLVDYLRDDRIVASLAKGLAQRPLWFCRSRAHP